MASNLPEEFQAANQPPRFPHRIMDNLQGLENEAAMFLSAPSSAVLAKQRFQHSPLDHQAPSVRLIRILPDLTSDGLVQCEIRHASTRSTYVCLSYVWGEEHPGHWISLAGRVYWIRENLHNFLHSARRKPHICSQWIWADALCIDQSNDSERSHQVQQMGQIFSHATNVISWMGMNDRVAHFLRESKGRVSLNVTHPELYRSSLRDFFQNEYWGRAWITQEVALARKITFMAADEEADLAPPNLRSASKSPNKLHFEVYSHAWRGTSLIYLLQHFKLKKCSDSRDRIFSLLGLCGEGALLVVDYEKSHVSLAKRVLRICSRSFCLCSVHAVSAALSAGSVSIAPGQIRDIQSFAIVAMSTRWDHHVFPQSHRLPGEPDLDLRTLCAFFVGNLNLQMHPQVDPVTEVTPDSVIYHFMDYNVALRDESFIGHGDRAYSGVVFWLSSCAYFVSYRSAMNTWDLGFPYETLAKITSFGDGGKDMKGCSRINNSNGHHKLQPAPSSLRMCTQQDFDHNPPKLDHIPAQVLPNHGRNLRRCDIRPYLNSESKICHYATFEYERNPNDIGAEDLEVIAYQNGLRRRLQGSISLREDQERAGSALSQTARIGNRWKQKFTVEHFPPSHIAG